MNPGSDILVHSFDVFDTCVSRRHAHPRDLFFDLGTRLAPNHLPHGTRLKIASKFQRGRILAEKLAYAAAKPNECADIDAIYRHLPTMEEITCRRDEIKRMEIELEEESIYAMPRMIETLRSLRQLGKRIIFVSDMYLPAGVLAPILKRLGVMEDADGLYVSCDVGLSKHSGKLFEHVLKSEGVEASQMSHTGDNAHADVTKARRAGISASHATSGILSRYEAALAGKTVPRPLARSSISALSRRTRHLMAGVESSDFLDSLLSGIVAPFLISYVDWVLRDARTRGIDRLYFVARDGDILYRIAQLLRQSDGSLPRIDYLHGSRRAWLAPSIRRDMRGWTRFLTMPGQLSSARDIADRIGLSQGEQSKIQQGTGISAKDWSRPLQHLEATGFIERMCSDETSADILFSATASKRALALDYFGSKGMLDGSTWALVDAGWALNSQAALARILARDSGDTPLLTGYYFALTRDHLGRDEAGIAHTFLSPPGTLLSRRRVIIEHCFTPSLHPTTTGYARDSAMTVPSFGRELRSERELSYARRLHEMVTCMAGEVAAHPRLAGDLRAHRDDIVLAVERLLRHPTREEARILAGFGTVADLRHEAEFVEPLCRSISRHELATIAIKSVYKRWNSPYSPPMWLEGSGVLSPPLIRVPMLLMLMVDDALKKILK